jgi:hypothetical protein
MRKRRAIGRLRTRVCASALFACCPAAALAQAEAEQPPPASAEAPPPESESDLDAPPATDAAIGQRQVYTPEDFARYAPRTALDMLRNVPGFAIESEDQERGLGQASGNVLINGRRISSKSSSAFDRLGRISASDVVRIEIVDGATLNVPGLSGRVANVVARSGGMSGRFEWRPQYATGPAPFRWSQGDVSVSGTRGVPDYTLSLGNDSFYGGSGGAIRLIGPDGAVDRRYNESDSISDRPTVGANLGFDLGETLANLNLSYGWQIFRSREDEVRIGKAFPPLAEELRTRDDGHSYEISGDIEFPFGPGRLKLIGLESYERSDFATQARLAIGDLQPDIGSRFTRHSDEGERIGRAEYRWNLWGADWQLSSEAAFNRLDNVAALFVLDPTGDFVEIPFPAGTGGVREDRYETILSFGRPLTSTLSLQLAGGGEHSTISQTGPNALSRSFLRPKGLLNLAWAPREGLDISFEAARRVGQLDFGDFLAAVNLSDDNTNAGNNQLRPPQSWEFELEISRDFDAWGSATATLFEDRIEDFVTIIPVASGLESRGNVPSARRRGYTVEGTWRFDPLGFAGAKLDFELLIENSRLKDPVTGIARSFDRTRTRQIELDFRHDIPRSDLAWGAEFRHTEFAPYFRVAEYGFDYVNPTFGAVFVEHKDFFGLTVRARAANLLRGDTVLDRLVYAGPRDRAPLLFREDKRRELGIIFNLNVSGSF